jgi:D-glycero-alpha-D-manno-heptose-7-phosphate kinase
MQDQLAAAYGGVHAWDWPSEPTDHPFKEKQVLKETDHEELEKHLLLAYCGAPHVSRDINGKWVRDFLSGKNRKSWQDIALATKAFVKALSVKDWASAIQAMNQEVDIRCTMTPEVFDDMGKVLREKALAAGCGARFTGAGGGGCIWAIGTAEDISDLRTQWQDALSTKKEAGLLDVHVDTKGLEVTCY